MIDVDDSGIEAYTQPKLVSFGSNLTLLYIHQMNYCNDLYHTIQYTLLRVLVSVCDCTDVAANET